MKKIVVFLLTVISCQLFFAQEYSGTTINHKIKSKIFEDEREIRVFLPYSYSEVEKQNYSALYLFDAQFDAMFDMTTGISDYLSQINELSEFIIVGIKTKHRPREFTPKYLNEKTLTDWNKNQIGEANLLEDYLLKEVFPLIDKTYRINPYRLAIGHSLGGTFVLNSILSHPEMFQGVIAISPNVSYDYEQLVSRYDDYFKTNKTLNKFIHISVGTMGNMENRFARSSKKLDEVIAYYKPKNLVYKYEVYEGENHSTTPLQAISKGLMMFGDLWNMSEENKEVYLNDEKEHFVNHIKAFYSNLSEWAGYEVLPSVNEINSFGYDCLGNNKPKEALLVFNWALELYPNDANLYDSKGEAFEKNGDVEQAKVFCEKALLKLEENKESMSKEDYDYYKQAFTKHLEKL